jgi:hypothetical protein
MAFTTTLAADVVYAIYCIRFIDTSAAHVCNTFFITFFDLLGVWAELGVPGKAFQNGTIKGN